MTQTRKEALTELLEKVDAGGGRLVLPDFKDALNTFPKHSAANAWDAYHGSIDAAKDLHEAVLPGWIWGRYANGGMWIAKRPHIFRAPPMMEPARGLLWCDIKALIAQEPEQ